MKKIKIIFLPTLVMAMISLSLWGGNLAHGAEFANPLGVTTLKQVMVNFINNLWGVIVILAIIFIVIGAILYMTSAGDEKKITRAKATVTYAVIGFAIAAAAPTFLKEILLIFESPSGGTPENLVDQALTIRQILVRVMQFLLAIVGVIAIISLVYGGSTYLTAYGDEKRIDKAKSIITYSIIGIVVALGALVIIRQVSSFITP